MKAVLESVKGGFPVREERHTTARVCLGKQELQVLWAQESLSWADREVREMGKRAWWHGS